MSLPEEPYTRVERYLARLSGQNVDIPEYPITRLECYLDYLCGNGGGVPASNAGAHNAVFRGKDLGTSFTSAQSAAITAGTFDDLFVGDYWTIGGGVYRIAGFDVFSNLASGETRTHHAVVMPDGVMYAGAMYTESMTGGYGNSDMKTTGLATALATFTEFFGESHLVTRRDALTVSISGGAAAGVEWVDTVIDLPTVTQVIGVTNTNPNNWGTCYSQFPVFEHLPRLASSPGTGYWFRDISGATTFLFMSTSGFISAGSVTTSRGVRPFVAVA